MCGRWSGRCARRAYFRGREPGAGLIRFVTNHCPRCANFGVPKKRCAHTFILQDAVAQDQKPDPLNENRMFRLGKRIIEVLAEKGSAISEKAIREVLGDNIGTGEIPSSSQVISLTLFSFLQEKL